MPALSFLELYVLTMLSSGWAAWLARRPQTHPAAAFVPWFGIVGLLGCTAAGFMGLAQTGGSWGTAVLWVDSARIIGTGVVQASVLYALVLTGQSFFAPRTGS